MMTGKAVFIVCLLFALAHRAGSECLLLADVEPCQDLPEKMPNCQSKWLPLDDDSSRILPAENLHLEVSPSNIFLGQTEVLTVNCSLSLSEVSNMSGITSFILSTSVTKENQQQEKFVDLVFINGFTPNQITRQSQFEGSVVGQIDNDGVSFIAIEWSNPTEEHAGLIRCKVHGMDDLGYPTEVVQTKRVTSQQPNVNWLIEKFSLLQTEMGRQDSLAKNQSNKIENVTTLAKNHSHEIAILSTLADKQSDKIITFFTEINTLSSATQKHSGEINTLSTATQKHSDNINTLSTATQKHSDNINTLSTVTQKHSDIINNHSDEINKLATLVTNQSDEINKLVQVTRTQSQIIATLQSQLNNQSVTITDMQTKLKLPYKVRSSDKFHISLEYNNHFYLLSKDTFVNSTVSDKTCQDYGGYLAQINDDSENQFIKNFINQQETHFWDVLVSGTDENHEGRWTYTGTDDDIVYTDWRPGRPYTTQSYNCIGMYKSYQWQWVDYSCTGSYTDFPFLCEVETV